MTSAQAGELVKKYPIFADKQYISMRTEEEGVKKSTTIVKRPIWKTPSAKARNEAELQRHACPRKEGSACTVPPRSAPDWTKFVIS